MINILLMAFIIFNVTIMKSQQVKLDEIGISFSTPEGWSGQLQGEYFLLGHKSISGLILLFQNEAKSVVSLKNLAMKGIIEEGISLSPKNDFQITSQVQVEGIYEGYYDSTTVNAFAIGIVNINGKGASALIITETNKFSEVHVSELRKLTKSIQFFSPKDSETTSFWKNKIVGQKLKYLQTTGGSDYDGGYSGTSEVVIINLYNNNKFSYYSNSNASFDSNGGFGHINNNEETNGDYLIYTADNQTFLELTFSNESTLTYRLTQNNEEQTFLNGSRYFVVDF